MKYEPGFCFPKWGSERIGVRTELLERGKKRGFEYKQEVLLYWGLATKCHKCPCLPSYLERKL